MNTNESSHVSVEEFVETMKDTLFSSMNTDGAGTVDFDYKTLPVGVYIMLCAVSGDATGLRKRSPVCLVPPETPGDERAVAWLRVKQHPRRAKRIVIALQQHSREIDAVERDVGRCGRAGEREEGRDDVHRRYQGFA